MLLIMKWTSGTFSFFSTFERIAKNMLLAQINLPSSSEETQEDDSESEDEKAVKQSKDDNGADKDGKFLC